MLGPMQTRTTLISAALAAFALLAPSAASAQDTTGSSYVKETHGAWQIRCLKRSDGQERCQMYQQLKDSNGTPTAEINIFAVPADVPAAAGAAFVTPLMTLLQAQLRFQVDSQQGKRYPFAWCDESGCIVRAGITADEIEAMKKGSSATVGIVAVSAPTTPVNLKMSLSGFTAAYTAMQALNPPLPPAKQ